MLLISLTLQRFWHRYSSCWRCRGCWCKGSHCHSYPLHLLHETSHKNIMENDRRQWADLRKRNHHELIRLCSLSHHRCSALNRQHGHSICHLTLAGSSQIRRTSRAAVTVHTSVGLKTSIGIAEEKHLPIKQAPSYILARALFGSLGESASRVTGAADRGVGSWAKEVVVVVPALAGPGRVTEEWDWSCRSASLGLAAHQKSTPSTVITPAPQEEPASAQLLAKGVNSNPNIGAKERFVPHLRN